MSATAIGFIGLGNMGAPMAANLAAAGRRLVLYDAAITQDRVPAGTRTVASASEVARQAPTLLLCLPDGPVVEAVCAEIAGTPDRRVSRVVDHSTIGIAAAQRAHAILGDAGIEYVDAPISGGVAGARDGTLTIMVAASNDTLEALRPLFDAISRNAFLVGSQPGQGQAMKVLNNFLSGTAMAATSEAVAFGVRQGLGLETILDVLNVSSGQNTATADKFPRRILTGTFDAGFSSTQMNKDLSLYEADARLAGVALPVSIAVRAIWRALEEATPGVDISRIYPFVRDDAER